MKKGFTLIELLAVIIILAVLAVIVTPIISNIIKNTKKSAFKQSIIGIISASENYVAKVILENGGAIIYPIEFTCDGNTCTDGNQSLEFAGTVPLSGKVTIAGLKDIYVTNITNGVYCYSGDKANLEESNCNYDISIPIITAQAGENSIILDYSDDENVVSVCVSKDGVSSCGWINVSNNETSIDISESGIYYCYAKDNDGNISMPYEIEVTFDPSKVDLTKTLYGLYNGNNLIVSWYDLVNVYGLDIEKNCPANDSAGCGSTVLVTNSLSGFLKIPPGITKIGKNQFRRNGSNDTLITGVEIPSTVVEIEAEAFNRNSTSVFVKAVFENTSNWYLIRNGEEEAIEKVSDAKTMANKLCKASSSAYWSTNKWINKSN